MALVGGRDPLALTMVTTGLLPAPEALDTAPRIPVEATATEDADDADTCGTSTAVVVALLLPSLLLGPLLVRIALELFEFGAELVAAL